MSTTIRVLIPVTVAVYLGFFFIFGEEVFDTGFTDTSESSGFLDGIINFFSSAFDFAGDILQFVTLGGFDSPVHPVVQTVLLLSLGLGWFLTIVGIGRGTNVT